MYGFAIYKKTLQYVYFGGGQGRREIIFRMWKQKPLRVIAGK